MTEAPAAPRLLHLDAALIALDKPAGLPVQGGSGVTHNVAHDLAAYAKHPSKPVRLVHRLDRETSGVLVAARTKAAAAALSAAFAGREVEKVYWAIVCGVPPAASGLIDLALRKASRRGLDVMEPAQAGAPGAQSAQTAYRVLAASSQAALVEARPRTGRMHQIRAHFASIGCPIAGDAKYGGLFVLGAHSIPRLMLHAAQLTFAHPTTRAPITLAAPLPSDFRAAGEALGLLPEEGP